MLFGWCLICWIFNFNIICVILLWLWLLYSLVYGSRVNKLIVLVKVSLLGSLNWFLGAAAVLLSSVCCTEKGWISHINREQYCVTELNIMSCTRIPSSCTDYICMTLHLSFWWWLPVAGRKELSW